MKFGQGSVAIDETASGDGPIDTNDPWCPFPYIAQATIHGNIGPIYRKITVGNPILRPLEFYDILEITGAGLEKGRYTITQTLPGKEYFSDDKKAWIRSGHVDGWCWYYRVPEIPQTLVDGSRGALHVTAFQGDWGMSPPPKPKGRLGYNGTTSQNLNIALPPGSNAYVLLDGTGSAKGMDSDDAPTITSYAWTVGGASVGSAPTGSYNVTDDVTIRLKVIDQALNEATDNATVAVEQAPCPDGSIYQPEGCPDSGGGGPQTVGLAGSAWRPAIENGGPPPPVQLVCYVTDWYDVVSSDGWQTITYNSTTIDYCTYE